MAIYHLSVKAVSRSAGRSATAAAAYRSGCKIVDERTGEVHDYTRKGGVESADIVLPAGAAKWAKDRAQLWNAAELAETRKNACVAREFEVALPHELSDEERRRLALEFAQDMADREGCAVDVAIHAPSDKHDNLNHHAHILRTTRKVEAEGMGAKLDTEQAGRNRKDDLEAVRLRWAQMTNAALERNGIAARVDHRTLEAQGIEREASKHLGRAASEIERRTGEACQRRDYPVGRKKAAKRAETAANGVLATQVQIEALQNEIHRREIEAFVPLDFEVIDNAPQQPEQAAPFSLGDFELVDVAQIEQPQTQQEQQQQSRAELAAQMRKQAAQLLADDNEKRDGEKLATSAAKPTKRQRSDDLEM